MTAQSDFARKQWNDEAAAIEQLRKDNARLRGDVQAKAVEIDLLMGELAACKKDAERYRLMRTAQIEIMSEDLDEVLTPEMFDAEFDAAAMGETK